MHRTAALAVITLFVVIVSVAQQSAPVMVPDGVRIPAVLKSDLSASAKVGDAITLETTDDVKGAKGELLVPKGAKLTGRITRALPYDKQKKESAVSLVVERAEWKKGSAVLRAFIVGKLRTVTISTTFETRKVVDIPLNGPGPMILAAEPSPGASAPKAASDYKLRVADDPAIASEVFSAKETVRIAAGSTFDLLNSPGQK